MKKGYVITLLLIVASFIIIIIIYNVYQISTNINTSNPQNCNIFKENESGRINIVYLTDNKALVESYTNTFLNTQPYKNNSQYFNFYYREDTNINCDIYQKIALLCYNSERVKLAKECNADFIVSFADTSKNIRSSTYKNFISININHPNSVLIHEFGHAIGELVEEYITSYLPHNHLNCVESCDDFNYKGFNNNNIDGCFKGCSLSDLYRSIDEGVMRTLSSSEYGKYNEYLIENKIQELLKNKFITKQEIFRRDLIYTDGIEDNKLIGESFIYEKS